MNKHKIRMQLGLALKAYEEDVILSEGCTIAEGLERTAAFCIGFFHAQGMSFDQLKKCVEESREIIGKKSLN